MIEARVVLDSISEQGHRLTTIQYTAHRFILAEINTHRKLSKNARSSRAVPTPRLCEEVKTNPAIPLELGKNQPGMIAGEPLTEDELRTELNAYWEEARIAAGFALSRHRRGVHKQWANRGLEPYLWVHGLLSSTSWENFFNLRIAPAAQPEFRVLAEAVKAALDASTPKPLLPGEWHLPYFSEEAGDGNYYDGSTSPLAFQQMLSVARCARVSIAPFDGNPTFAKEKERFARLLGEGHWSPFEHVATPDTAWPGPGGWTHPEQHRNYDGWRQYRALAGG